MINPDKPAVRGLRVHDLVGLVVGYGMASLLARTFWSSSRPLASVPTVALALEFLWLGLAMSGPILLLLDRRGVPGPGPRPRRVTPRLGRSVGALKGLEPIGQKSYEPKVETSPRYTRAELAWMAIGGYWIALTVFVVPALSIDTPWPMVGLLQVVAAVGLWLMVPSRAREGTLESSWTHSAAVCLMITWPIAWGLLILLSRSH